MIFEFKLCPKLIWDALPFIFISEGQKNNPFIIYDLISISQDDRRHKASNQKNEYLQNNLALMGFIPTRELACIKDECR